MDRTGPRIRQASPLDLRWLATFDSGSTEPWVAEVEGWARRSWSWYRAPDTDRHLFVAEGDDRVIGVTGFERRGDGWFCAAVCAHHQARRSGVGAPLLKCVIDQTVTDEQSWLLWRVHQRNEPGLLLSDSVGAWRSPISSDGYFDHLLPA